MLEKLRTAFDHPYAAPLAKPIRNVAAFAIAPVKGFVEALKSGFDDKNYYDPDDLKAPKLFRAYEAMLDLNSLSAFGPAVCGIAGGVVVGIMAVITAFPLLGAGLVGGIGATVAGIAAAAVGVVVGPFVAAGAVASAGFVAGCTLGIVPGVIQGLKTAIDHARAAPSVPVASAAASTQLPPKPSAPPAPPAPVRQKTVSEILSSMSAEERRKTLESLQEDFAEDYKAIFNEKARQGLQEPIEILRPIRIRKQAAVSDAAAP